MKSERQKHIEELRKTINSRQMTGMFTYITKKHIILYILSFLLPPYALIKLYKNSMEFDNSIRIIWAFIIVVYMIMLFGTII